MDPRDLPQNQPVATQANASPRLTIMGTRQTVRSFDLKQLRAYLARNYRSPNMIVSAAGAVNHEEVVADVAMPDPFPRMTYAEAIRRYASDKPDLRIDLELVDVADLVAEEGPPLPVVAGDLNSREESEVLRQFRRVGLVDHGGGVTSPSVAPHQRLDYVLVPETVVWRSTHTPETDERWQAISDHLPVVLEFDAP